MFNKTIALAFTLATAFGFAQTVNATEAATAPATVIIYRADESVKTKRVNMGIMGDSSSVGRLKVDNVVVAQSAAGDYTLTSSLPGAEALTLELKPGGTYYVHAKMKMTGSRVTVDLQQVPEQVARIQQPALDSVI